MNRNSVKLFGLLLLFVFGFMAATPFLAQHSDLYNTTNFSIHVAGITWAQVTHDVNGLPIGKASPLSLLLALSGEMLLLSVFVFAPAQQSRHIITHRR